MDMGFAMIAGIVLGCIGLLPLFFVLKYDVEAMRLLVAGMLAITTSFVIMSLGITLLYAVCSTYFLYASITSVATFLVLLGIAITKRMFTLKNKEN